MLSSLLFSSPSPIRPLWYEPPATIFLLPLSNSFLLPSFSLSIFLLFRSTRSTGPTWAAFSVGFFPRLTQHSGDDGIKGSSIIRPPNHSTLRLENPRILFFLSFLPNLPFPPALPILPVSLSLSPPLYPLPFLTPSHHHLSYVYNVRCILRWLFFLLPFVHVTISSFGSSVNKRTSAKEESKLSNDSFIPPFFPSTDLALFADFRKVKRSSMTSEPIPPLFRWNKIILTRGMIPGD